MDGLCKNCANLFGVPAENEDLCLDCRFFIDQELKIANEYEENERKKELNES